MSLHKAILLLGSNLGDRKAHLNEAINSIEIKIGNIIAISDIEETKPVEFESNNFFCNIALSVLTNLSPFSLLKEIKKIERKMGRIHDSFIVGGYVDRLIDIDIIQYDEILFMSEKLEIPHQKHLFEREFSKKLLKKLK